MSDDTWESRVLELTLSLRPNWSAFKLDDPITFCLSRRSELLDFIKSKIDKDTGKSASLASKYMRVGDECSEESLEYYNQCICHAPPDWTDLPVAFAKRADPLRDIGYLKEAIQDIDMAISHETSIERLFHLVIKKAEWLYELGELNKAEEWLCHVLKDSDNHFQMDDASKMVIQVMAGKVREDKVNRVNEKVNSEEVVVPAVRDGENPDFPFASNCIEVQYSKEKGRHVIAKCDIKMGDVLFVERPFSYTCHTSLCHGCCLKLVAPLSCSKCVTAQYCSIKCRQSAWESHHKFECGYSNLLKDTGVAHLALRTLLAAAPCMDDLKRVTKQVQEAAQNRNPLTFSKDPYENVYMLISHADKLAVPDVIQYALTATLISLYLLHYTSYGTAKDENVVLCGNVLLRHSFQLVANAMAMSGDGTTLRKRSHEVYVTAIYPSISMMNHSCEPSIAYWFHKDCIVVRAWKDLQKGEEVFNSYVMTWRRMNKAERQRMLRPYFFECSCVACSQERDPYAVLNSLKCDECCGPVVEDNEGMLMCLTCSHRRPEDKSVALVRDEIKKLISLGTRS